MGWGGGTFAVKTPQVIYNALSVGYRHLDLAENYNNLHHIKKALSQALAPLTEGGLGIERKDIWITMKIPVQSINNINALHSRKLGSTTIGVLKSVVDSMIEDLISQCNPVRRNRRSS